MVRLLIQALLGLLANAIGLLTASWLLDGFELNMSGLITATIMFTVATVVLGPLIMKIALTNLPALMGGIALVTTLIGLMITAGVTDGLSISGLGTWVAATLVVWLFSLLAGFLLPLFLFKKALQSAKGSKPPAKTAGSSN